MWNIKNDYTVDLAEQFLLEDFRKVIQRARFLYVQTEPPQGLGYGLFEPITLSLCWCDFLGSLYCGNGERDNTKRSKKYITEVLGEENPRYKAAAKHLVKTYRNGAVHAYAPDGNFTIHLNNKDEHLSQKHEPHCLVVSVDTLLSDLEQSVVWYAENIRKTEGASGLGTLTALNRAHQDLLKYVEDET
ncbi:MAG: hypothetical protein KZQ97_21655 [Candidatus Thiodiazotropha sp. (ex Dulcina madagascariensis)]|nr:hypothetical protein [Candidatus Thiodiazotropha sp. (ex Dulcina madagascariensis)]